MSGVRGRQQRVIQQPPGAARRLQSRVQSVQPDGLLCERGLERGPRRRGFLDLRHDLRIEECSGPKVV